MIALTAHPLRRLFGIAYLIGAPTFALCAHAQTRGSPAGADTTCRPCRDFYRFANRAWLDTATIPPSASVTGPAYDALERTLQVVKTIVVNAAADTTSPAGSGQQQIGAFYTSCMDSVRIEQEGLKPLASTLAAIDAVRTPAQVAVMAARLQRMGVATLFGATVAPDQKNTRNQVLTIAGGGIGLPSREYYFRDDAGMVGLRVAYVESIARSLQLTGVAPSAAAAAANRVMVLETALAAAMLDRLERRNPDLTYNKLSLAQVGALAPILPWEQMLQAWHTRIPDSMIVRQPKLIVALGALLEREPISDWRAYLRWRLLSAMSPNLSSPFAAEAFRLSQRLSGVKELQPRSDRCVSLANVTLGDVLGRAYVEREFPPTSKAKMIDLIENVRAVMMERIRDLAWMSEATKREALAKMAAMRVHAGYPDKWDDYSNITMDRSSLVANLVRVREFRSDRNMARLGTPPIPGEWTIGLPQVFDGLAGPLNAITITAAAFQPPWYDRKADDAVNYGSLGFVIAHEMTHHFDVAGRRYDDKANLRDWWTPEDAARYNEQAKRVIAQYDSYTVLESLHVDGKLTLAENMADLGGLKIAYLAWQRAGAGKPRRNIGGYTPEQRFFLGFARGMFLTKTRPEYLRQYITTNGHAPDEYRVNGPLSNMPEFATAFACQAGDPMVRPANVRAEIW